MMRLRILTVILAVIIFFQLPITTKAIGDEPSPLMGGSGTMNDPYKVTNVHELQNISFSLSSYHVLENDINATTTESWDGGKGFSPIGSESSPFTGDMDGNGYNITGLFIDRNGPASLFAYSNNADISNLNVEGDITGRNYVGLICGKQTGGSVKECNVSGKVTGFTYVGGLVGHCSGSVDNCKSDVLVRGVENGCTAMGGITGLINTGSVTGCYFNGTIRNTGGQYIGGATVGDIGGVCGRLVKGTIKGSGANTTLRDDASVVYRHGGFVGLNNDGIISDCWSIATLNIPAYDSTGTHGVFAGSNTGIIMNSSAAGSVSASAVQSVSNLGGFTGYNSGYINTSYTDSSVYGNAHSANRIGGFAGYNYGGFINNSFSNGDPSGSEWMGPANYIGGLVGWNRDGKVTYCYSTGDVNNHPYSNANGGFIGQSSGDSTIISCFWDMDTSGRTDGIDGSPHPEIIGKHTVDMKKNLTFTSKGWDFNNTWAIIETVTYPIQRAFVHPPEIIVDYSKKSLEDEPFICNISVIISRSSNSIKTYEVTTDADWLDISSEDFYFQGTPVNKDVGIFTINVTVTDLFDMTSTRIIYFEILNVNDPPVIQEIGIGDATEDEEYLIDLEAIDIDPTNDKMTWSMDTNASWLTLDEDSGVLSGTPENDHVGIYFVNLTVKDGHGGNDTLDFTLPVHNVNDPPVIKTTDVLTTLEDELYRVNYTAYDEDPTGDIFSWNLDTNASWLRLNGGNISGTPHNKDVGFYYVNISVEDGNDGQDYSYFTLEVVNVNDPPVITSEPKKVVNEDEVYYFEMSALEVDKGDEITWSFIERPLWLSIDTETGILEGIPSEEDVGIHNISIRVEDMSESYDDINFTIEVFQVNDPPVITVSNNELSIDEDGMISIDLKSYVTDVDTKNLTFSSDTSEFFYILIENGTASVFPKANWSGEESITFTIDDGEFDVQMVFNITVREIADEPFIISSEVPLSINEGDNVTLKIEADDVDIPYGDELEIEWSSNISGFLGIGSEIHVELPPGQHEVTATIRDSTGLSTVNTFQINVTPKSVDDIPTDDDSQQDSDNDDEGGNLWVILIIIVIVLLVAAGLAIFLILRKSGKEKEEEPDSEVPGPNMNYPGYHPLLSRPQMNQGLPGNSVIGGQTQQPAQPTQRQMPRPPSPPIVPPRGVEPAQLHQVNQPAPQQMTQPAVNPQMQQNIAGQVFQPNHPAPQQMTQQPVNPRMQPNADVNHQVPQVNSPVNQPQQANQAGNQPENE